MIDKSRAMLDDTERLKAYHDIQKYLADKIYTVSGLPGGQTYTLIQPWVHDYAFSPSAGLGTETYAKAWVQK
jgi:hypothetical protein